MNLEQNLNSLESLLDGQIAKVVGKGDISPTELENMTKTLCLLEKIKEYKEYISWDDEEGASQRRYSRRPADPYMMMDNSYGDAATGMRHARSYSRPPHGYSGHSIKDRMIDKLESMYDEAKTDHERQIVDEWINRLNSN